MNFERLVRRKRQRANRHFIPKSAKPKPRAKPQTAGTVKADRVAIWPIDPRTYNEYDMLVAAGLPWTHENLAQARRILKKLKRNPDALVEWDFGGERHEN